MAHIQKVTTKSGRIRFQARYIDPAGRERAKNFTTRGEARAFVVDGDLDFFAVAFPTDRNVAARFEGGFASA